MCRLSTLFFVVTFLYFIPQLSQGATCLENIISVNSTTQGELSSNDCRISDILTASDDSFTDLYTFQVNSSNEVCIALSSSTPNFDPFLRLLNDDLTPIADDDDSGAGINASITTTLPAGSYKILANTATNIAQTGNYTLTLNVVSQPIENTRLINIATRGFVGTEDSVLIAYNNNWQEHPDAGKIPTSLMPTEDAERLYTKN